MINGKLYVGSATDIPSRWRTHKSSLNMGKHHNRHLQRAWNKYGEQYFMFVILECVEDVNQLLCREQWWINMLSVCTKGYNILEVAGSMLGFHHSDETKERLRYTSSHMSEEARQKISVSNRGSPGYWKGKKMPDYMCKKFSRLKKGKKFSDEHIQNMCKAQTGSGNAGAKLAEEDVLDIRRRVAEGQSQYSVAKLYGITPGNVGFIIRRETWKHI